MMSKQSIDPQLTINEIIQRRPSAVTVFNAYGIDSCCGGGKSLADVTSRHEIDLSAILSALEAASV